MAITAIEHSSLDRCDEHAVHDLYSNLERYGCLTFQNRMEMRRLSKKWSQSVDALATKIALSEQITSQFLCKFSNLRSLTIYGGTRCIQSRNFVHILAKILKLRIKCLQIDDWCQRHFSALEGLDHLKELRFENSDFVTDESLNSLSQLTRLTSLSFLNCSNLEGRSFKSIANLKELKALEITSPTAKDWDRYGGLRAIRQLSSLKSIRICPLLPDQAKNFVDKGFTNLEELTIVSEFRTKKYRVFTKFYLQFITNALWNLLWETSKDPRSEISLPDLNFLKKIPKLTSLDLSDLLPFGDRCQLLSNLVKLTHLSISNQIFHPQGNWEKLSRLENLQSLSVLEINRLQCNFNWRYLTSLTKLEIDSREKKMYVIHDFWHSIEHLQNLKVLKFCATSDTPILFPVGISFKGLTNLTTLVLRSDFTSIIRFPPNVVDLKLASVRLDWWAYKFFQHCLSLTTLDLSGCRLNSPSEPEHCPEAHSLDLELDDWPRESVLESWRINAIALKTLKEQRPGLKVHFSEPKEPSNKVAKKRSGIGLMDIFGLSMILLRIWQCVAFLRTLLRPRLSK